MDLDQKTSKLIVLFMTVNLVAAAFGFVAVVMFGAIAGLTVFTILIILLPVSVQYVYLSNKEKSK